LVPAASSRNYRHHALERNPGHTPRVAKGEELLEAIMVKFLLWLILLVLCWPLALLALVLYPLVWLLLLPFRLVGIAVGGVLELLWAVVTLPARALRGHRR
jgi:hypothetical protein